MKTTAYEHFGALMDFGWKNRYGQTKRLKKSLVIANSVITLKTHFVMGQPANILPSDSGKNLSLGPCAQTNSSKRPILGLFLKLKNLLNQTIIPTNSETAFFPNIPYFSFL